MTTRSVGDLRVVKKEGNSLAGSFSEIQLSKVGIKAGDVLALKLDAKTKTLLLKKMNPKDVFAKSKQTD